MAYVAEDPPESTRGEYRLEGSMGASQDAARLSIGRPRLQRTAAGNEILQCPSCVSDVSATEVGEG